MAEALMIFHQKATFIGSINRQYDNTFVQRGAKKGDTVRIRKPNQYLVGDGEAINPQETEEETISLKVNRRKHVALQFTTEDLSLKMDKFADRVLEPGVSVLVSVVDGAVFNNLSKQVHYQVDQNGTAFTFDTLLAGREVMINNLVPDDGKRTAILKPRHGRKLANDLKANQNPVSDISKLIRDGHITRVASFGDIYESSHVLDLTTGTAAEGATTYQTNQVAAQDNTSSLIVDTGSATFKAGEIIEVTGVNEVHHETKVDTGRLMQFVITADVAANATAIPISPALVATGPKQNVTNGAADNKAINKRGAGNGELLNLSMAYHEDFATFATADLVLPNHGGFQGRKNKDGISLRIVDDYEVRTDLKIARLDILCGEIVQLDKAAVRLHADG